MNDEKQLYRQNMKNFPDRESGSEWRGIREVDRAIAENRLTAYTWQKTWADPWGRAKMITVFALLAAFLVYLAVDELIL